MFGYIVYNEEKLSEENRIRYKKYYCGLCQKLKDNYGSRKTLTYDVNFIHILLSSLKAGNSTETEFTCPLHPFKKMSYIQTDQTDYCAAVNNLLFYYKLVDDYHDDGSRTAQNHADRMYPQIREIEAKYPQISETIQRVLSDISAMEKDNVLNPDLPANAFGHLMGCIFAPEAPKDETLYSFGFYLGKFIYLMDAVVDFRDDLKKQHYNPLVQMDSNDFEDMLLSVMQQCADEYEKLDIKENKELLDNVIYSGIWSVYFLNKERNR